ncbi:MAG: dihydropyrimidinase [Firmicutes bacterium]|jgi:dihydropyrimidinase|nr:dihydropyrimidinase [Bacillota bacterium]
MDLTLRNGLIITATDTFRADIGIEGDRIVEIAANLPPGRTDFDLGGKWIVPGFIDVHTHFDAYLAPYAMHSPDDFESGTRQAACGGVTSVVDYAFQSTGDTLHDAVSQWDDKARERCYIDYGFHTVVVDPRADVLAEMADMVQDGYPSFKVFMMRGFGDLNDRALYEILKHSKNAGGIVTVHAENGDIVQARSEELFKAGRRAPHEVPYAMPPEAEGEATQRIITLAGLADNAPVYIVHLSSISALEAVRIGRQSGQQVYAETRPTYLLLDDNYYAKPAAEAVRYMASPPFRSRDHVEALWNGLRIGDLQTVASDHTAWNFHGQKELGINDFTRMPPGIPAVETMGPLLFTFGVQTGRITINKWVEVLATNPAKLFGLHPRKGTIAVGADADLVVYDPKRSVTLSKDVTHSAVDYEPYDGFELTGYPILTFSRGTLVMKNGELMVQPGHGQLLRRNRFTSL